MLKSSTNALFAFLRHRRKLVLTVVAIALVTYFTTRTSPSPDTPPRASKADNPNRRSLHEHFHRTKENSIPPNTEELSKELNTGHPELGSTEPSLEGEVVQTRKKGGREFEHHNGGGVPQYEQPALERLAPHRDLFNQQNQSSRSNATNSPLFSQKRLENSDEVRPEDTWDALPDVVHIPFEDAVRHVHLQGWEDEWVAHASYNQGQWGKLNEPTIDFVYLWVNGSDEAFERTKHPYELQSVLNDAEGKWLKSHGVNRYRDWDELRYSIRSVEKHASGFRNNIQIIVNSIEGAPNGKQSPSWLRGDLATQATIDVIAPEEFFDIEMRKCLPTFNSLTIENQLFNTASTTENFFALSDDMLLGRPHAASDIFSSLFGPAMGFKTNSYSATAPPTDFDAHRFGEKPFLIYTSWLLNKRFGVRKRKGQGHFGHSLSRAIMHEALSSFPGPEAASACKRFRGEPGFQLYSWYVSFHYLIERHREALLWSYILLRSDVDGDGHLSLAERKRVIKDLKDGRRNEGKSTFRKRNYYHVAQLLQKAGLEAPKVNTDILWTSLDGPHAIRDADCSDFDVNDCLGPGFVASEDPLGDNPMFSAAVVFDRVSRQNPKCGDCVLKLVLNMVPRGLDPLLPDEVSQAEKREMAVKAVMRYQYMVINPDALFVMVTDAEQVDSTLISRFVRGDKELPGQLCLNDDVSTEDGRELADVREAMTELYQGLFPDPSAFEK